MRVIFAAYFREIAGMDYLDISLEKTITVNEFYQILLERVPKFRELFGNELGQNISELTVIVDKKVCGPSDLLPADSVVELLMPIPGG